MGSLGGIQSVDKSCTEIIVVRHGQTEWNVLGKLQGQTDTDLTDIGKQQAQAVAERLSREPDITTIYASDLKRARETAQAIASKYGGFEVITDRELRERHVGDLQGLLVRDAPKLNPVAFDAWMSERSDQEIPGGGESRDELQRRCTTALKRIAEKHRGERIVVVTHGVLMESLYKRVVPEAKTVAVQNTSISILQLSDGDVWVIKSWNDTAHLSEKHLI